MKSRSLGVMILLGLLFAVTPGFGQEASEAELAKKTQNPVSDLISLPFQNNLNLGYGPENEVQNILNIQPVVPLSLSSDWNLITRTILPVIHTDWPIDGNGLGDLNISLFLSPAKSGKIIWGLGPVIAMPTATDDLIGSGKWSTGPTAVVLTMPGRWVVGILANHLWDFAGQSDRSHVNATLIQYFINYNLPDGWYLSSAPIITANWSADSSRDIWTVPFGGGGGKIFRIGKQPMNAQLQAFYNVEKPQVGPDWTLRFQLQFLFPK
ncbi:MAG: neuromedin U [Nitrospirota bacterium]